MFFNNKSRAARCVKHGLVCSAASDWTQAAVACPHICIQRFIFTEILPINQEFGWTVLELEFKQKHAISEATRVNKSACKCLNWFAFKHANRQRLMDPERPRALNLWAVEERKHIDKRFVLKNRFKTRLFIPLHSLNNWTDRLLYRFRLMA